MGGQWEKGSAAWEAANFFLVANVPFDDDTTGHVRMYHSICNRARMGRVCFDVARESGNVKYACKVRTDMILWHSSRSAQ